MSGASGSRHGSPDPGSAQPMELSAKEVLLLASRRAQLLYPGPVGELLHQELVSWLQFGHLLGSALIFRVAEELVQAPIPTEPDRSDGPAALWPPAAKHHS